MLAKKPKQLPVREHSRINRVRARRGAVRLTSFRKRSFRVLNLRPYISGASASSSVIHSQLKVAVVSPFRRTSCDFDLTKQTYAFWQFASPVPAAQTLSDSSKFAKRLQRSNVIVEFVKYSSFGCLCLRTCGKQISLWQRSTRVAIDSLTWVCEGSKLNCRGWFV